MQPERSVPIRAQAGHARSEILVRLAYAGVPWALFALLTVIGTVLRVALAHVDGNWLWLASPAVALAGCAVAALDWHLRRHRMSLVGRAIGPVTTAGTALMTAVYWMAGFSMPLALTWTLAGASACLAWNFWSHLGASHDLTVGITALASKAGLGNARFIPDAPAAAKKALRPRKPPALAGRIVFDGGAEVPADQVARAAALEQAGHFPPGSLVLRGDEKMGGASRVSVADPAALARSVPWPGPSAPGAPVDAPFRLGVTAAGPWARSVVPVAHWRASGKTGSGKTTSLMWNFAAEGVSREDFAMFGFDVTKRWQFFGPLATAMHGVAVEPEQVLTQYLALARARKARLDYMAARGLTQWTSGCGLTFLASWMEEAPSVLAAIAKLSRGKPGAPFKMEDWSEGIKADRSAGIMHAASMQFGLADEFSSLARAQFSPVTFGTSNRPESKVALSPRQYDDGARPELWGANQPGTAYADLPGMSAEDAVTPVRFYDWGKDAALAAAYFTEWPADARPLDDITGEAMDNAPAAPPSYGLPGPGGTLPGRTDPRSNVRQLFSRKPSREEESDAAVAALRRELAAMLAAGTSRFGVNDLTKAGVWAKIGRTRPWGYKALQTLAQDGYVQLLEGGARARWEILPAVADGLEGDAGEQ